MSTRDAGRVWPLKGEVTRLVRAVQQGDPGALDALLARLRPSFVAYFARRIPADDAEDWTQVALIGVVRAVPAIDADRAAAYMMRMARNLLHEERRRRARAVQRAARHGLVFARTPPITPDRDVEYRDLVRAVRTRLATLAPELRAVVLGVLHGLSPAELAAQHHVRPATIRTRLLRARARLRPELECYADAIPVPSPGRVREQGSVEQHPVWLLVCSRPGGFAVPEVGPRLGLERRRALGRCYARPTGTRVRSEPEHFGGWRRGMECR